MFVPSFHIFWIPADCWSRFRFSVIYFNLFRPFGPWEDLRNGEMGRELFTTPLPRLPHLALLPHQHTGGELHHHHHWHLDDQSGAAVIVSVLVALTVFVAEFLLRTEAEKVGKTIISILKHSFKEKLVRAKSQSMQLTRLQIIITGGRRALQLGGNGRHHLHYLDRHQLPGTCHWPGFKFFLENGWICWITTSQRFWSAAFSSLQNAFTHCLTYFGSLASTTSLLGSS